MNTNRWRHWAVLGDSWGFPGGANAKELACQYGNSEGVKAGGKLKIERRKLTVSGLEENLLDELVVDITELGVGKSINVADLNYEGLKILTPASTPVVSVLATRQSGR